MSFIGFFVALIIVYIIYYQIDSLHDYKLSKFFGWWKYVLIVVAATFFPLTMFAVFCYIVYKIIKAFK